MVEASLSCTTINLNRLARSRPRSALCCLRAPAGPDEHGRPVDRAPVSADPPFARRAPGAPGLMAMEPAGARLVLLHPREAIQDRVQALAGQIRADYAGRDLVVVGVLKGAFVFMADLIRAIGQPLTLDFVGLSSYGAGTRSSGAVTITKALGLAIAGKDVLVVEDVLDTGLTMRALLEYLRAQAPRSLRICALLDKRERRTEAVPAEYVGFALRDGFVAGYGIDWGERYRELPDLYRVEGL
jgi:hypoxanthine phosphoribosyltransferase